MIFYEYTKLTKKEGVKVKLLVKKKRLKMFFRLAFKDNICLVQKGISLLDTKTSVRE